MSYNKLRIAKIIQETPDARSFVLDVPADLAEKYRYRAGQFLTFKVGHPDGAFNRCYSLSSAPETDGLPKVTVKRVTGGKGSNWFHDALKEGGTLDVLPPAGRFVLSNSDATLLLFGGGSGITPMMSLIKSALKGGQAADPPVLCQPRQAVGDLRRRVRGAGEGPSRTAGDHPSSRRRAGHHQARGDRGGDEGLRSAATPISAAPARSCRWSRRRCSSTA